MSQNNKEHRIHNGENSLLQVINHVSRYFKLNKYSTIPLSPKMFEMMNIYTAL
jgi:hypothetical protein